MLRTITIGSSISIQGLFIGERADGKIMIQVDGKTFVGTAVPTLLPDRLPRHSGAA